MAIGAFNLGNNNGSPLNYTPVKPQEKPEPPANPLSYQDNFTPANNQQAIALTQAWQRVPAEDKQKPYVQALFSGAGNYARQGNQDYNLNNPQDVKELLQNSPQLDASTSTTHDANRCAGASLVALGLLDGKPEANAQAMRKTGEQFDVTPTPAQADALKSWEEGHLKPNQVAELQEYAWKASGNADGAANGDKRGINLSETAGVLSAYRNNGGITNLESASINGGKTPTGAHATATATNSLGETVTYDPWPNSGTGKAEVTQAKGVNPTSKDFMDQVTVVNDVNGSARMDVRQAVDSQGKDNFGGPNQKKNYAVAETQHSLDEGAIPAEQAMDGARTFYDAKTGKPLPPAEQERLRNQQPASKPKAQNQAAPAVEGEAAPAAPATAPAQVEAQSATPAPQSAATAPAATAPDAPAVEAAPPATPPAPEAAPKKSYVDIAPLQIDATGHIASKEVGVSAAAVNKGVAYQSKNVQASAGVQVASAAAYAGASASVDLKNLKINAEVHAGVEANLVDAQASANVRLGTIGDLGGNARARVGADAVGGAGVGFDPKNGTINVGAEGEAFTGARANAGVNLGLGPVGAHAGVAVQAGVGIMAGVDVGLKNGKFSFNLDFGFSLGLGIRFNIGFDIDFKAIGKGIVDGVKAIGKGIKKLGQAIGKGAKKMAKAAKKMARKAKKAAKKAVKWMGKTAKKAFKKVGKTAKKAAKKMKKLGKKVGKKLKRLFGRRKKHKHHKHHKTESHKTHKAESHKSPKAHKPEAKHEHHHMKALKKALHLHQCTLEHVA
ncbi:hypothetical protein JST97_04130 [bacterium]|nr:hypothetical protein [bacterium]